MMMWSQQVLIVSALLDLLLFVPLAPFSTATAQACFNQAPLLPYAEVPPEFCPARVFRSNLNTPRGVFAVGKDLLVLERGSAQITVLWDANNDGQASQDSSESAVLASAPGINHAVIVDSKEGYLYAASSSSVFRWPYPGEGTHSADQIGAMETVVVGIPSTGHSTRTPTMGPDGLLYVSVGSASNMDADASRSAVKRFNVSNNSTFPLDWTADGEYFASGFRNEAGLRFDEHGVLWGVENGADNWMRPDLGGDVHNNMPCEEFNRIGDPREVDVGRFFGYPQCHSEYALPSGVGLGAKTQWAHADYYEDTIFNDAWCRRKENVVPPALCMEAHVAPLDLLFWEPPADEAHTLGTVIQRGDALVPQHGSWNRVPAQGYKLIHVPMESGPSRMPKGCWHDVLSYAPDGDTGPGYALRPVAVATMSTNASSGSGMIFISSDATGEIIVLQVNVSAIGATWNHPCQIPPPNAPAVPIPPEASAAERIRYPLTNLVLIALCITQSDCREFFSSP